MLTSDECKTGVFAVTLGGKVTKNTGSCRDELGNGILRVSVETGKELVNSQGSYVMFECEAYFEAYKHNLKILQDILYLENTDERVSMMSRFVVWSDCDVGFPSYFESEEDNPPSYIKLPDKVNVDDVFVPMREDWDSQVVKTHVGLNAHQYDAYRTALTSELAVIQGPPGTGKTYVGLQVLKTLLLNRRGPNPHAKSVEEHLKWGGAVPITPIMVLCYTNHALDQFLELLVVEIPGLRVARVGGQCKSELVKRFSVRNHRELVQVEYDNLVVGFPGPLPGPVELDYVSYYGKNVMEQKGRELVALEAMRDVSRKVWRLKNEISELSRVSGVFDFEGMEVGGRLKGVVPCDLYDKVCGGGWLLDGVLGRRGYGWEEDGELGWEEIDSIVRDAVYGCFGVSTHDVSFKGRERFDVKTRQFERVIGGIRDNEEYDMDELLDKVEDLDNDELIEVECKTDNWRQYCYGCSVSRCEFEVDKLGPKVAYEKEFRYKLNRKEELRLSRMIDRLETNRIRLQFFKFVYEHYEMLTELVRSVDRLFFLPEGSDTYVLACDVETIPLGCRWGIYFNIVKVARRLAVEMVEELENERVPVVRDWLRDERMVLDKLVVGESHVVGFTTTGAAKMRELVVGVRPEIVMVEEAAEILESHVITSLTGHCKHLILIGDHLQLRPTTCVYELQTKYQMNVSLFERLIMNGVPCCTLRTQHRMRPEIADLVVGTVYNELLNHNSVYRYPNVRGVKRNMYFVDHAYLEDGDTDTQSKSNQFEAEFLTGLCEYLVKQGYNHSQITVLTGYSGQMFLLKKLLNRHVTKGLRITTVDNYQGEENDIVLLSLVRSNPSDKVGFIGIDNRICVALSRARHGLYVVGNMGCMKSASSTWRDVYRKLVGKRAVGGSLELVCGLHGKVSSVACREDFEQFVNGGCEGVCGVVLACGHVCSGVCHSRDHSEYKCEEVCLKTCGFGHTCGLACWVDCYCGARVTRVLTCGHSVEVGCEESLVQCGVRVSKVVCGLGHEVEVECWVDPGTVKCSSLVKIILGCGHEVEVACHVDPGSVKCSRLVNVTLSCGHDMEVECGRSGGVRIGGLFSSRIVSRMCVVEVDHVFPGCKHEGKIQCWNIMRAKCTEKCGQTLECGHVCKRNCHVGDDPGHELYGCREKYACQKTCLLGHVCKKEHYCKDKCVCVTEINKKLDCGHEASIPCGVSSTRFSDHFKCRVMVSKVIPLCGHTRMVECHVAPSNHKCTEKIIDCGRVCDQGHPCPSDHGCSEECMPCIAEKVEKSLKCGHTAMLYCHDNGCKYKCKVQVSKRLICGHTVEMDCHSDSWRVVCEDKVWTSCDICRFEGLELCRLERKRGCCSECSKLFSRRTIL